MANHNINRVFVSEKVMSDMVARFKHEGEQSFDFNDFIPMPAYIYKGNLGQKEKELYGENNWYDWSIANWNTKWNAYWIEWKAEAIEFYTAWSAPIPIFKTLSKIYPNEEISVYCADEGGCYVFEACFRNGEEVWREDKTEEGEGE